MNSSNFARDSWSLSRLSDCPRTVVLSCKTAEDIEDIEEERVLNTSRSFGWEPRWAMEDIDSKSKLRPWSRDENLSKDRGMFLLSSDSASSRTDSKDIHWAAGWMIFRKMEALIWDGMACGL